MGFISFAISIFAVACRWLVYNKANEPGWASLIPYYNDYVLCKISGKKNLFWARVILSVIITILMVVMMSSLIFAGLSGGGDIDTGSMISTLLASGISFLLIMVIAIALTVIDVFVCIGLAKQFGQPTGFGIGLAFLSTIFMAILAFSSDMKYVPYVENNVVEDTGGDYNTVE